jgi:hypothetical protein
MTTAITNYTPALLDRLAEDIDEAQETWEAIDWEDLLDTQRSMPCPECGGRGETSHGTTDCFVCNGARVVERPSAAGAPQGPPKTPPFAEWRRAISTARRGLQAQSNAHQDGEPPPALPAVALPTLDETRGLKKQARDEAKKALAAARAARHGKTLGALPGARTGGNELPTSAHEEDDDVELGQPGETFDDEDD